MSGLPVYERFQRLQRYVGWTTAHEENVRSAKLLLQGTFPALVEDFYQKIQTEPAALKVITGGQPQIARLKLTLVAWLENMFSGPYDQTYVEQRWRTGWRHVEIGLEQALVNVAMSRLRDGLLANLERLWKSDSKTLCDVARSISRLIDLDLAIIQDAYETEYVRRQRDDERKRSEAAFRNLVEAAGSMIVILREDQSIAYINPFAESLTSLGNQEVQGTDFAECLIPAEQRDNVRQKIHRAFAGESARDYESGVSRRSGQQRWLLWNIRRIEDFAHGPAVLLVGQDITERVKAEERALQAERLAAIGQTIAGLAHESRNALQRSQAALEVLEFELDHQPEQLELVDRVKRSLGHLHRLYEEVRDYAAPIRLDRQECNLASLWRGIWSQLDVRRGESAIELSDAGCSEATCNVDWFALGQVFRNLFENAIDALGERGTINVSCQPDNRLGRLGYQVSVRDGGEGVPADIRTDIFKPFYTTRPKGTGLGLAITKRIVEAHGGTLSLGSPDIGAEFLIWLPAANGGE
ncbi:MAG: PAS domain S-box protein [Planctomycetes bacterium]|jgi:two-component system, LuxR family, sensor kinase FixL|nr:PAS domain S-box protein [Planctomycetota bacterium]